jgi:vanillate O-demethylase monooxygenase subunit
MGKLEGGVLTCGYHGLAFSRQGTCVRNPFGPASANIKVKPFAVCEAYDAVWLWGGDPAAADPTLIPALACADRSGSDTGAKGYLRMNANYELLSDNIMDLSHIDFLHPGTLGSGAISRTRPQVVVGTDRTVKITWLAQAEMLSPALRAYLSGNPERGDIWTEVVWHAPAIMDLRHGATYSGRTRGEGMEGLSMHIMTPETETSTHYFFSKRLNTSNGDAQRNQRVDVERHIFNLEDRPMLESQQKRMGSAEFWSLSPALLPTDVGAARARRILQQMIQNESQSSDERGENARGSTIAS